MRMCRASQIPDFFPGGQWQTIVIDEEVASFVTILPGNYYHFLTEYIPKCAVVSLR